MEQKCEENHYYCPLKGKCEWKDSDCRNHDVHVHCSGEAYFCRHRFACIKEISCDHTSSPQGVQMSLECPQGFKFCSNVLRCVRQPRDYHHHEAKCPNEYTIQDGLMAMCDLKDYYCVRWVLILNSWH